MAQTEFLKATSVAVLSDMHLGAGNNVLDTPTPAEGLKTLEKFLDLNFPKVDAFILLGDIFDLSMGTYAGSIARGRDWLEVIKARCNKIVFVPGAHDHQLWNAINEERQIFGKFPEVAPGYVSRTEQTYTDTFLSKLVGNFPLEVTYPNVYWRPPANPKGTYVFHHGHFCEELSSLAGDIYTDVYGNAASLDGLEGVNAAWMDAMWYRLGQTGPLKAGGHAFVEEFYEKIEKGDTIALKKAVRRFYEKKLRSLVRGRLGELTAGMWFLPKGIAKSLTEEIEKRAADWLFEIVEDYFVREEDKGRVRASAARGAMLDREMSQYCEQYLEKYVRPAQREGLGTDPIRFVFGHTHVFGAYPDPDPRFFNTGSWMMGPQGQWPDAYVFHIDEKGKLTARRLGVIEAESKDGVYPW